MISHERMVLVRLGGCWEEWSGTEPHNSVCPRFCPDSAGQGHQESRGWGHLDYKGLGRDLPMRERYLSSSWKVEEVPSPQAASLSH